MDNSKGWLAGHTVQHSAALVSTSSLQRAPDPEGTPANPPTGRPRPPATTPAEPLDPHARFVRTRLFGSFDGLRALSIVPVVWHHAAVHHAGVLGRGHLGVQLFFAISGFLITTLLLRERDRTGTVSLRSFYVRRALRIFPLYYAVLAIYVGAVAVLERDPAAAAAFWAHLPAYVTYTSNWFVTLSGTHVIFYFAWSLATEEQFYLVWPSLIRAARRPWAAAAAIAALLLCGEAARWAADAGLIRGDLLPVRIARSIATPICLGSLGAIVLHSPRGFRVVWAVAGARWSALAAAGALALVVWPADVPLAVIAAAMAFLVIACAIRPDHALRRVLESRALRYVGTISYGMYLLHMLAINVARRVLGTGHGPVPVFLLGLALTIAAASVSYRYFEARFLALKERFSSPRDLAPAADASARAA